MGDPGLLKERPDIPALLSEAGGDRAQSAAPDRTLAGLDAPAHAWQIADFTLNHRLARGKYSYGEDFVYCSIVGGFDSTGLQKGPKAIRQLQELLASVHSVLDQGVRSTL